MIKGQKHGFIKKKVKRFKIINGQADILLDCLTVWVIRLLVDT
jgi:adenosyl cobinamide kinase/adenosyl cobinamide phosphate guanylyltransferase